MTLQTVSTKPRNRRRFGLFFALTHSPRETGIQGRKGGWSGN